MITLRVKQLREAAGLSQTALAEKAGIRRATIIEIEKGRTTGVDFDVLDRLAVALGVDAAMLIVHSRKGRPHR
jgi:transcriptional regulator with XRE-family HTH domain